MRDKILVVLPAFNEEKVISNVIKDIKKEGFKDILVVDDCSSDNTYEAAKKSGAIVLRHVINRGAGAATYTGLTYARSSNYDYAVTLDSDGQHSPRDIFKLLRYSKKYDIVIGSRMIDMKNMPLVRRVANFVGSISTGIFFGVFVRDSQSGFKIFNKKVLSKLKISYDRYEFCSEIIGEIGKHKFSFIEVPIEVIYTNHSLKKKGSGQSIKYGFKMLFKFLMRK